MKIYLVVVEVRTFAMGAMNAEAVPASTSATKAVFMVKRVGTG